MIPSLVRDGYKAYDPRAKAEILKKVFFSLPILADLSDILKYYYLRIVEEPRLVIEKEIIRVIKNTGSDKVLRSDNIPNRILYIIVSVTPVLIKRLF